MIETLFKVNAFDWEQEFPDIFRSGGFDAVVGNPPWGALLDEAELKYLRQQNQAIIVRMIDTFMYFVHQGSQKLKAGGYLGMILPDVVLYQTDNQKLRDYLLGNFKIHFILNMGDVFKKVTRPSCIIVCESGRSGKQKIECADLSKIPKLAKSVEIHNESMFVSIAQDKLTEVPGSLFVTSNLGHYSIWRKVKSVQHRSLSELVDDDGIQRGVSPDLKDAFLVDAETVKQFALEKQVLRKVVTGGKQVKRYFIDYPDLFLIYTQRDINVRELPNIRSYIDRYRDQITCKEVQQHKHSNMRFIGLVARFIQIDG